MLFTILCIVIGVLGASSLITAKVPDADKLISRIAPFKAFIGVGALVLGVMWLLDIMGGFSLLLKSAGGIVLVATVVSLILVSFVLAMPQIAKWIPGDSAPEEKAMQLQKKLLPFEVPLGVICIVGPILSRVLL